MLEQSCTDLVLIVHDHVFYLPFRMLQFTREEIAVRGGIEIIMDNARYARGNTRCA